MQSKPTGACCPYRQVYLETKGLSSNSLTLTFYSAIWLSELFGTVNGGRGLNWAPKARLRFGVGVELCKRK
jgi:hypothetical protein